LGGGVFGFPPLPLGDGMQQQNRPRWYVWISRGSAFPHVGPVLEVFGGLDGSCVEELPNKFASFRAVVIEGFVRPFTGDQDPAPGDAEVLGLVGFALAPAGDRGVPGALGLDAIQQPHWAPRRARGDPEFVVESPCVIALGLGGVLAETGGPVDRFGYIFCEVANVPVCFLGAAEDSFDVYLCPESNDVRGFG
jgi:hypothetical protein